MALARKGTRKIIVDGIAYRWVVLPDDKPGLRIVVECADSSGKKVITGVEDRTVISPGLVRTIILHALFKGWQFQKPGQAFGFGVEGGFPQDTRDSDSVLSLRCYPAEDYSSMRHLALKHIGLNRGKDQWGDALRQIADFYQDDQGELIVGCIEKQIVAIGVLKRASNPVAEILRIVVHPDFQGRGYGQQLLEYLEAQAMKSGYRTLKLHTTSLQVAAQRLYQRNGYIEIRRQPWRGMERLYFQKHLV
jgi:ribosomal protein S18 acetylase RimI-like enzyme